MGEITQMITVGKLRVMDTPGGFFVKMSQNDEGTDVLHSFVSAARSSVVYARDDNDALSRLQSDNLTKNNLIFFGPEFDLRYMVTGEWFAGRVLGGFRFLTEKKGTYD
jgi:hypothetical protein